MTILIILAAVDRSLHAFHRSVRRAATALREKVAVVCGLLRTRGLGRDPVDLACASAGLTRPVLQDFGLFPFHLAERGGDVALMKILDQPPLFRVMRLNSIHRPGERPA
jgi:hypothetical protein